MDDLDPGGRRRAWRTTERRPPEPEHFAAAHRMLRKHRRLLCYVLYKYAQRHAEFRSISPAELEAEVSFSLAKSLANMFDRPIPAETTLVGKHARWLLIHLLKSRRKQMGRTTTFTDADVEPDAVAVPNDFEDEVDRPETVRQVMSFVDERRRKILRLYYFEGLTFEETGRRMKISLERARQIRNHAVRQIRVRLGIPPWLDF